MSDRPERSAVALFALCFGVAGLVALALLFGGTATYEQIARSTAFAPAVFRTMSPWGQPDTTRVDLPTLVDYHARWLGYVTAANSDPPVTWGRATFTADEYRHMADVRRVFIGAEVTAVVSLGTLVLLIRRGLRRGERTYFLLLRDGAVVAGVAVAAIAFVAAVAFDQAFQLFHEVFFPQGNFLFGPDSNLLAIYPDAYWYGVTIRMGISFLVLAAGLAGAAAFRLPRR